ncbi:MAG: hypothetical protein ABIP56_04370 [Dokdonella sp.]
MSRFLLMTALLASALQITDVQAEVPQVLKATVGDAAFISDDNNITLIPLPGSFTLIAATAGADAYPPPKTPVDRLSISCNSYAEGKATTYTNDEWGQKLCQVEFVKGEMPMGGEPNATYTIDKSAGDNLLEITSASGKVIEGRFHFTLKSDKGVSLKISEGSFKAEDRQR